MEERLCIYTAREGHGVEIGRSALAVCELQHRTCRSTPIFVGVDQRLLPSERAKGADTYRSGQACAAA
jgi:hypothetical protein